MMTRKNTTITNKPTKDLSIHSDIGGVGTLTAVQCLRSFLQSAVRLR
jgi:hypothetical protein